MTFIPDLSADLAIGSFTVSAIGGPSQPHDLMEKP
jgi:hypothetical protein